MTLAKDIASHLLKIQAVYLKPEEPFTWASGIKSPVTDTTLFFLSDGVRVKPTPQPLFPGSTKTDLYICFPPI